MLPMPSRRYSMELHHILAGSPSFPRQLLLSSNTAWGKMGGM